MFWTVFFFRQKPRNDAKSREKKEFFAQNVWLIWTRPVEEGARNITYIISFFRAIKNFGIFLRQSIFLEDEKMVEIRYAQ